MKKILSLVLSVVFIFVIGFVAAINVRAGITTDENIKVVDVDIVNVEGIQGIRYFGSIGEYPKENVGKYGILLAYGYVEDSEAFVKKGTINDKRVIHAEAGKLNDDGKYSVTLYDIPETAYLQYISARAYVELNDGSVVYGTEIYYNNLTTIALDLIDKGTNDAFVNGIPEKVHETLRIGFVPLYGGIVFTSSLYEMDPLELYFLLGEDYYDFAGELLDNDEEIAGSKALEFFNDPEMNAKWGFILDLNTNKEYKTVGDALDGLFELILSDYTSETLELLKSVNKTVYAIEREQYFVVGKTYRFNDTDFDFFLSADGYTYEIDGEAINYQYGKFVCPEEDVVVPVTYTFKGADVSFFKGDELLAKVHNDGESEIEIPEVELAEGEIFCGWYDSPEFLGSALKEEAIKSLKKDTDLYALIKDHYDVTDLAFLDNETLVNLQGIVVGFQSDGNSNDTSKSFMGLIVKDLDTGDLICVSGLNSWGKEFGEYEDNEGTKIELFDKISLTGTYYTSSPKSYSSGKAMPTKAYINLTSDSKLLVLEHGSYVFAEEAITINNNEEFIEFASDIKYGTVIKLIGTEENPICIGGSGSKAPFNLKVFMNKDAAVNDDTKYNGIIFSLKSDTNELNTNGLVNWYSDANAFSTITGPFVAPKAGAPYHAFVGEMYVVVCFYTSTYYQMSAINFNDWTLQPLNPAS